MGNMHYATMLGYYAQLLGETKMLQLSSKVHETIVGYGTFGSAVGTDSRFGLPVGIKAGGIELDIPMSKVVIADNNNKQNFLNYRLQAGMIASSLEHQTPEQLYNTDPQHPVQGISTMKALALANQQGQKIYTITKENINEVLPKIQASSLVKGDISSSVYAGKTVTVHERPVSVPGWTGTGYMVIDPVNGDGAFLIGGGGNGGWLSPDDGLSIALTIFGIAMLHATGAFFIILLVASIVYTAILTWYIVGLLDDCPGMSALAKWMAAAFFAIGLKLKTSGATIIAGVLSYIFGGTLNMAHDVCGK